MWIKLTTTDKNKHLINVDKIMDVYYSEETDLSVITYDRSAYPSSYIRGNIVPELTKIIMSGDTVSTIQVKEQDG